MRKRMSAVGMLFLVFIFSLLTVSVVLAEPMVVTYRSLQSENDARRVYQRELIKLALDKTKQEYGPYTFVESGSMTNSRVIDSLKRNLKQNFFVKLSYSDDYPDELEYIRFPVDLGIVGNRVCFISPNAKQKLSAKPTLDELKKLIHIQGKGWVDTDVLRHNGFSVIERIGYENKHKMIAYNRYDLFCRGINELMYEYEKFKYMKALDYDRTFALVYPLPRFLYTNKANKKAIERITKGLMMAFNDGSLLQLWRKNYGASIDFSKMEQRKIFRLDNPKIKGIDFDYTQCFYDLT